MRWVPLGGFRYTPPTLHFSYIHFWENPKYGTRRNKNIDENYEGAPKDGSAWIDKPRDAQRVLRGGSWISDAGKCRTANRIGFTPGYRNLFSGFQLALLLKIAGEKESRKREEHDSEAGVG